MNEPDIARLGDLDNFEVAEGDPDIRGWTVKTADGQTVGDVEELIVDTAVMKVRYMEVKADKTVVSGNDNRYVLIPIGTARLDADDDEVLIDRLPEGGLFTTPPYSPRQFSRDYEASLHTAYGAGTGTGGDDFYRGDLYDDRRFWGNRRPGREGAAHISRSEEELVVGTRPGRAGEVKAEKRVETEHVKKSIPVTREEVTVERRPASGRQSSAHIGKDEITIPVMEEEVVAEKRAVPKEEVVIRKEAKRDQKEIEADLRRERVDVKPKGDVDIRKR